MVISLSLPHSLAPEGYFYSANKNSWQGGTFSWNNVCRMARLLETRITAGKINNVINCCEILPECEQNPHVSYNSYSGKSTSFCCSPQFHCARPRSPSPSLMWRASGFRHNRVCLSLALRDNKTFLVMKRVGRGPQFQRVPTIRFCFIEPVFVNSDIFLFFE